MSIRPHNLNPFEKTLMETLKSLCGKTKLLSIFFKETVRYLQI